MYFKNSELLKSKLVSYIKTLTYVSVLLTDSESHIINDS